MADDDGGGDYENGAGGGITQTVTAPTGNQRTVAGFMAVAILFSVIGAEIKINDPAKAGATDQLPKAFSEPFIIIGGGTVATVLLTLIASAGEGGRKLGVGLAGLAMVTAVLVNGGPVWSAINGFLGGGTTAATTGTTPATKPTGNTPATSPT